MFHLELIQKSCKVGSESISNSFRILSKLIREAFRIRSKLVQDLSRPIPNLSGLRSELMQNSLRKHAKLIQNLFRTHSFQAELRFHAELLHNYAERNQKSSITLSESIQRPLRTRAGFIESSYQVQSQLILKPTRTHLSSSIIRSGFIHNSQNSVIFVSRQRTTNCSPTLAQSSNILA